MGLIIRKLADSTMSYLYWLHYILSDSVLIHANNLFFLHRTHSETAGRNKGGAMSTEAYARWLLFGALSVSLSGARAAQAEGDAWDRRTAQGIVALNQGRLAEAEQFFSEALRDAETSDPAGSR